MKSLRDTARKAGVDDAPLGVRYLAQRSGLQPPFSLSQLISELEKNPAGLVEEVKHHLRVITPAGTAMGGFVDLALRSNGTYTAKFHMRATGAEDYNFSVRAVFAASNGLAFALQHSGRVVGRVIDLTEADERSRNNDKTIQGTHPFIKEHWPAVKAGKFAVSKEYSRAGITGFIEDVAKTILDVTTTVARGAAGAVVALGDEMVNAFNSLELGGDIGVLAGIAVLAFGGGLVLAVTTGAAAGTVTGALVRERPITTQEANFAAQVFGRSLPPASKIILTNLEGLGGRAFVMPGIGGNIYVNIGAHGYDHPLTHQRGKEDTMGQLFIHELTHVWQIHHRTFVPGWVCEGLVAQVGNTFGDAYEYGPAGQLWSKFGIEEQASIVDDYFARMKDRERRGLAADDPTDPYFRYIRDNVRPGRP